MSSKAAGSERAKTAGHITFVMETSMDDLLPGRAKWTNLYNVDVYGSRMRHLALTL